MDYQYLEAKPDVFSGKMCVKGTRISVDLILEWLSQGSKPKEIVQSYPQISMDAIYEALQYASQLSKNAVQFEINLHSAA
jgi:uncharacterized protein (DUF433 family)